MALENSVFVIDAPFTAMLAKAFNMAGPEFGVFMVEGRQGIKALNFESWLSRGSSASKVHSGHRNDLRHKLLLCCTTSFASSTHNLQLPALKASD